MIKGSFVCRGGYDKFRKSLTLLRYQAYSAEPFVAKWNDINASLQCFGRRSTNNRIEVYHSTGDAFRSMWQAVDSSTHEVKWQTYICKDDEIGQKTVSKLLEAKHRGVLVELLYDCGGNITGRDRLMEALRECGATVIRHRPFIPHVWNYIASGLRWENSPAMRNHRKILIVDQKVAFAGGLNVGCDYCTVDMGGNGRFRDTHCMVVGPAVAHLNEVFEDTKKPVALSLSFDRWKTLVAGALRNRIHDAARITQQGDIQKNMQTALSSAIALAQQRPRKPLRRLRQLQAEIVRATTKERRAKLAEEMRKIRSFIVNAARQLTLLSSTVSKGPFSEVSSDTAIPEAAAFEHHPPITQIIACNPHSRDWTVQVVLWQVVRKAHRRVWVTTPYYMPHRKLVNAIFSAAERGVDVRIVTGSYSTTDPWFMWYASQYLTLRLLRSGVKIYEFEGGQVMHAKTVVVDSVWSSVGSYNWDVMSNKLLEVCVTTFSTQTAATLEEHFRLDVAKSRELTIETFEQRSLFQRVCSSVIFHGMKLSEKVTFWTYSDPELTTAID